jgi:heme/copper-type cytochrome/quinol oxidase subunit 2
LSSSKSSKIFFYILILTLVFSGLSFYTNYAVASNPKTIYVELSQFKYNPGRIIVNKGDTVILELRSTDVTHGFYIDGYNINVEAPPGEVVTIRITADMVGKFKIRCSVTCGPLHPFMVGDFLVEENNVNTPFIVSIGLILLFGIITLIKVMGGVEI